MNRVMIASIARTPIGNFDGSLKDIHEQNLGAFAMLEAIKRANIETDKIDKVVVGNAKQTSMPSNCARYTMLVAKLPVEIPAYTVQRQSASGLQAFANSFYKIKSGNAEVILVGGTESMSLIPLEIHDARYTFNENTRIIFDPIPAQVNGAQPENKYGKVTIESINQNLAKHYNISEQQMSDYVAGSVKKANESAYDEQITSIEVKKRKTTEIVDKDEIYSEISYVAQPGDGAAMSVLVNDEVAKNLSLNTIGEVVSFGISSGNPASTGILGIEAVKSALEKAKLNIADIDIIEINEMSAAQCIATCIELKQMGLSEQEIEEKVNPNGGSLATGNPWGAAGAILLTKILYELKNSKKTYGLIVTPAEGGQAMAMVVKRV